MTSRQLPPDQVVSFVQVLECIRAKPGVTCDELARDLKITPAVMSGVLRALKRDGQITSKGVTRGARYSFEDRG